MQRRKFIEQTAWLAGGFMLAGKLPANNWTREKTKLQGRVFSAGKGIANVLVSDGYSVVPTDSKGKYEFGIHPDASSVFVSIPAGYEFIHRDGIARHYYLLQDARKNKSVDFELKKLDRDDSEHQFIIWADPQVKNDDDVRKMMNESVPDVQKFVAAVPAGTLLHGITVGDIVWDEHKHFADYDVAVGKMGIPFFQCLGNHDMDYNKGGDESSDDTFQQTYGPTYYSFNRGKAHYVVMDNVRYLGKDRDYDGFMEQNQLDWLQKDLSFVPKDALIILCLHIPVHNGVKNSDALYALLQGRNVHIMSGHTHYHRNVIKGTIFEHNHGTVCGAWWTGPICQDGTPCGYGIYQVKGTELSWHYQSTGASADHQMTIFVNDADADHKQVLVNVWNYDPEWKVEFAVDGAAAGHLEQIVDFDPMALATLLGPELPKPRGFAEPQKTDHLFKALVPSSAKQVQVTATDRFGRKYAAVKTIV